MCRISALKVGGFDPGRRLSICRFLAFLYTPFHNHTAHATCQSCCEARLHPGHRITCVDWKQSKHVRKTFFRSLKTCFAARPLFSSSYRGKHQCFRSPCLYPHIDVAWIGSSPSMCEKTNRSLKNCFSAKPDFIP